MDPLEAPKMPRWPHPDGHPPKNKELLWRSLGPSGASGGAMINLDIPSPGLWMQLVTSKEGESFQGGTSQRFTTKVLLCCSQTDV